MRSTSAKLMRSKSTLSIVSPARRSPLTRKSTPCPENPLKLKFTLPLKAWVNSRPGNSCVSTSCTLLASARRMSSAVITRVCTGLPATVRGVRVPVTTAVLSSVSVRQPSGDASRCAAAESEVPRPQSKSGRYSGRKTVMNEQKRGPEPNGGGVANKGICNRG